MPAPYAGPSLKSSLSHGERTDHPTMSAQVLSGDPKYSSTCTLRICAASIPGPGPSTAFRSVWQATDALICIKLSSALGFGKATSARWRCCLQIADKFNPTLCRRVEFSYNGRSQKIQNIRPGGCRMHPVQVFSRPLPEFPSSTSLLFGWGFQLFVLALLVFSMPVRLSEQW